MNALIVLLAWLIVELFRCRKQLLVYVNGTEVRDLAFPTFMWGDEQSILMRLAGVNVIKGAVFPVYLPLVAWTKGSRGIVLEIFLETYTTLLIAFLDHWPFIAVSIESGADKFKVIS